MKRKRSHDNSAAGGSTIHIQRLNMDSSWLFVFGNKYNVLIDPWLVGGEVDGSSVFNYAEHLRAPVSINRLPGRLDAIVISMPFSDHCHEETIALLPPDVVIFAAPAARARLLQDAQLAKRQICEIGHRTQICPGLRATFVPTSGILDFTHSALVLHYGGSKILYAPHGLHDLSGLSPLHPGLQTRQGKGGRVVVAPKRKPAEPIYEHWLLCLLTASRYAIPWYLGGTVNLGLQAACSVIRDLQPRYVVDTHSEQKHTSGLVPLLATPEYPSHREICKAVQLVSKESRVCSVASYKRVSLDAS